MEKSRSELKNRYKKGDKPTEQDYADLIDSFLHRLDDNFVKSLPDATTTQKGIVEQATLSEVESATDDTRFVTPQGAKRAAERHAPVLSVNGKTGEVVIPEYQEEDTGWNNVLLHPGVTNDSTTYQVARFRKKNGIVYIEGHIKIASTNTNGDIFTLPTGYRPPQKIVFASIRTDHSLARIEVRSGGVVTCTNHNTSGTSISGISFIVD